MEVGGGGSQASGGVEALTHVTSVQKTARAHKSSGPRVAAVRLEALQQRQVRLLTVRVHIRQTTCQGRSTPKRGVFGEKPANLDVWIGPELQAAEEFENEGIAVAD